MFRTKAPTNVAIRTFSKALEHYPYDSNANMNLGALSQEVGNIKNAIKYSQKATYFFCVRLVLHFSHVNFSLSKSSSSVFEHAGQIKPSKAIIFLLIKERNILFKLFHNNNFMKFYRIFFSKIEFQFLTFPSLFFFSLLNK